MSKYLITGAAGFLGARISEILLSSGHKVTAVDNLNDNYDISLKQHRLERFANNTNFNFFKVETTFGKGLISSIFNNEFNTKYRSTRCVIKFENGSVHVVMISIIAMLESFPWNTWKSFFVK